MSEEGQQGLAGDQRFDAGTVVDAARRVLTEPDAFYRTMPRAGGFGHPVLFMVAMGAVVGVVATLVSLLGLGGAVGATAGLAAIVVMPVVAVVGSFIGATIMFVIWRLMGSTQSYEVAYRCVAYAGALYPITFALGIVPYLGSIIAVGWTMFLMIAASVEVHDRDRNTALMVFGAIGALLVMLNLSAERSVRRFDSNLERFGESLEDMSPQDAGRKLGEFMKGLEEGSGGD